VRMVAKKVLRWVLAARSSIRLVSVMVEEWIAAKDRAASRLEIRSQVRSEGS
jgi:hypothetical protein